MMSTTMSTLNWPASLLADHRSMPGPSIESPQLEHGADTIIFVRDGVIECMEVFSYADTFPETLDDYQLVLEPKKRS